LSLNVNLQAPSQGGTLQWHTLNARAKCIKQFAAYFTIYSRGKWGVLRSTYLFVRRRSSCFAQQLESAIFYENVITAFVVVRLPSPMRSMGGGANSGAAPLRRAAWGASLPGDLLHIGGDYMQCKCMKCGRLFSLAPQEAEKFRRFFEEQDETAPTEALGICEDCWKNEPDEPLDPPSEVRIEP
jgi:hypothetical protein